MRALALLLLAIAWVAAPSPRVALAGETGGSVSIGIEERLGETVPMDILLRSETGAPVALGDLVKGPTILSFIYFSCPNMCPRLISGLGTVLNRLDLEPLKEYTALTVSFDERDTAGTALEKKQAYFNLVGDAFPPDGWRFLTADAENISRITEAAGFRFRRDGERFEHPVGLLVLSPEGKIVRYLFGDTFLPFDLKMAITEASEGRVGSTGAKVLLYCFSYDPAGKKYVFNLMRLYGIVTTIFLVALFLFLFLKGSRREGSE